MQPTPADWRPIGRRANTQDQDQAAAAAAEKRHSLDEQLGLELELARDDEYHSNLAQIDCFERKFIRLAHCFRRSVNFFGLAQDVGLLLVTRRSIERDRSLATKCRKLFWLTLMAVANSLAAYVLVVHSLWELTRLDAKMSSYKEQVGAGASATAAPNVSNAGSGWLILKDFLENMRRHLSRYFGLAMILVWHRNCHRFELLFVDCRRYYAGFYQRDLVLSASGLKPTLAAPVKLATFEAHEQERDSDQSVDDFLDTSSLASGSGFGASERRWGPHERLGQWRQKLAFVKEQQAHFIATTSRFYGVARRRIFFALCWPISQVALNLFGIIVNSSALVASNVTPFSGGGGGASAPGGLSKSHALATRPAGSWTERFQLMRVTGNNTLADQLLANFHAFHLAIHTAFHPIEHQIASPSPGLSLGRSASYCVAELFVHYVYVHGPRVLGATCLSLVLSIHHQCLAAFNRHLGQLIKRARGAPLTRRDMIKLLKQYDMIGMMHERMEHTFKWSLGLWFIHMFVCSLMLIFTLTESTSAALLASSNAAANNTAGAAEGLSSPAQPSASLLETIGPIVIVSGRIVFICYGPWLIYSEAIKIELESAKTSRLVMMLARRQDDPVAQAIEPSLFEPLCFSLAGYFNLSKRTVASLFGAIVTFSIMFIGHAHSQASHQDQTGSEEATNEEEEEGELEEAANNELGAVDEWREAPADEPAEGRQLTRPMGTGERPSAGGQDEQSRGHNDKHGHDLDSHLSSRSAKFKTRTRARSPPRQTQEERAKAARRAPRLAPFYRARLRENERQMSSVRPGLKVEGGAEICDFELEQRVARRAPNGNNTSEPDAFERSSSFSVTWIDRISGEVTIEASELAPINCERQRNFTLRMRAIACNGLQSNEALMSVELLDVNEFSPEFERTAYAVQLDQLELATRAANNGPAGAAAPAPESDWCHLLSVRANDPDCSAQFGQVCRYELIESSSSSPALPVATSGVRLDAQTLASKLAIERDGRLRARCKWLAGLLKDKTASGPFPFHFHFQLVAFDCGGKKSQTPASVQLNVSAGQQAQCRAAWKDVSTQIAYKPASGEHWPFLRAHLDLCGARCGRLQLRVRLQLAASAQQKWSLSGASERGPTNRPSRGSLPATHWEERARAPHAHLFHCDRDPYAMVSKRRLCGSRRRALELLPALSAHTRWVAALLTEPPLDAEQPAQSPTGSEEAHKLLLAEEENLGAYLLDGSYGRLASEFARLEMNATQQAPIHGGAGSEVDQAELPVARAISRHRHQRKRQGREAGAASHQQQQQRRRLEPSAIYRDQVYHFDGLQKALVVPSTVYLLQRTLGSANQLANATLQAQLEAPPFGGRHTLSFWMRHEKFRFRQQAQQQQQSDLDELSRHVREHLLCLSDKRRPPPGLKSSGAGENGAQQQHHHYALYLRDCKLHLSVRTRDGHHSEWRWTLNPSGGQLCDNKWHLFTLNVNLPQVELYVDGQQFEAAARSGNLNSAPKRPGASGLDLEAEVGNELNEASAEAAPGGTRHQPLLTVGACWEARSRSMGGHLRAALSGLSVVVGANDEPAEIECLGRCTEALVSSAPQHDQRQINRAGSPAGQLGDNSALVSFQESQDRIQLEGHDLLDVEDALTQLAYVNRRELPSVGRRSIKLETVANCAHGSHSNATSSSSAGSNSVEPIRVEPLEIELNVQPSANLPQISLSGTPNLAREHAPFKEAQVAPFQSVRLRVKQVNLQQALRSGFGQPATSASEQARPVGEEDRDPGSLDYIDDSSSSFKSGSEGASTSSVATGGEVSRELSESVRLCKRRIEACNIQVRGPPLDGAHERLELPLKQLELLQLYWRQSAAGALIYGLDCVENYEQLLRQVRYQLLKPELYDERHFQLSCSDMSGRLLSNDYVQTLTIIHPRPTGGASAHKLSTTAAANHSSTQRNRASGAPPSYFASLRRSPELELDFGAPLSAPLDPRQPLTSSDTKLNRVAMMLLVFVISMMLIMLVIALTKLTESASGATVQGDGKRKGAARRRRPTGIDCAEADSFFAQDEEEVEGEEDEGDEEDSKFGDSQCEHDDELDSEHEPYFVHLHSHDEELHHGEPSRAHSRRHGSFTSPCDSLSWDDEMVGLVDRRERTPKASASATIVMNPMLFGQKEAREQHAKAPRMIVTRLADGTVDRLTTSLAPALERAARQLKGGELLPVGLEDEALERRRNCDLEEEEEEEAEAFEMEEEASVCSRSSSASSELDEHETECATTSLQRHAHNFHNFRPHYHAPAGHHFHFRHHGHFQHRSCSHAQQQQLGRVSVIREAAAEEERPSYEILHQHHHECLRAAARRRQLERAVPGEASSE